MKRPYSTESWSKFSELMQQIVSRIISIDSKITNIDIPEIATVEETLEYLGKSE